jgi:hypothetical protein
MRSLCVVFLYHRCDELTAHHLRSVREHNPDAVVVPVTHDVPEHLPDGVDLARTPSRWPTDDPWRSCDTMLYRWFEHHRVEAERYVVCEYDVLCTQPFREAYAAHWAADVACRELVQWWDRPNWQWFQPPEIARLPPEQQRFAAGVVPFTCAMFKRDALAAIVECAAPTDVFCELRLGTAVRKAGLRVSQFSGRLRQTVRWHPNTMNRSRPGIYHSVKPPEAQARWENDLRAGRVRTGDSDDAAMRAQRLAMFKALADGRVVRAAVPVKRGAP